MIAARAGRCQKDSLQSVGPVEDSFMISMHLFCIPGNQSNDKEPAQGDKTKIYLYKHHQGCAFARVGLFLLLLAIHGRAQAVDPEVKAKCVNRYKNFQDDNAECSYLWNGHNDRFESKQSENKQSVPSLSFLCEERKIGARGVYRDDDSSKDDFETVFYSVFPECNALETLKTHYGRRLVGEWDGTAATGTYSLVKDTTTTATITVSGTLEIFGVVPAGSETRPAIDGGYTGGSNGHTVFNVEGDETILVLSNITIRNGYVSIF